MSRNSPPNRPLPTPPGLKGGYQNKGLNSKGKVAPVPPPKPGRLAAPASKAPNKPLPMPPRAPASKAPNKPLPAPPGLQGGYQNKGLNSKGKAAPPTPPKPAKFKPGNSEIYRYQDRAPKMPGAIGGARTKAAPAAPVSKAIAPPANPARGRTGTFGQPVAKPLPTPPKKPAPPPATRPRTGTFGQPN